MRAVIQRVSQASVSMEGKITGEIKLGFLILLGVAKEDTDEDRNYLLNKIMGLRIFSDNEGKMNLNIVEVGGSCLVVSQFTLLANTKKGNRPSFIEAAAPDIANETYEDFCQILSQKLNKKVEKGVFGADMKVQLTNDGPVTIILDSKNR